MAAARPVYGALTTDLAKERSEEARTTIALLVLVSVLSVATLWFVALPLFDKPQRGPEACQMFVMTGAGALRCVPETTVGAPTARTDS
jgi:hypothetical protein